MTPVLIPLHKEIIEPREVRNWQDIKRWTEKAMNTDDEHDRTYYLSAIYGQACGELRRLENE